MLNIKMEYKVRNFRFPLFAGSRLIATLYVLKSAVYGSSLLIFAFESGQKRDKLICP